MSQALTFKENGSLPFIPVPYVSDYFSPKWNVSVALETAKRLMPFLNGITRWNI